MNGLHNINIREVTPLPTPDEIKLAQPLNDLARTTVANAREEIAKILLGEDHRLLVVVGPCSIHNAEETLQYASKLATLAKDLRDQLLVVMRFCGDKPRTGKDWTGFWNDPRMDNSCYVIAGWKEGRELAIKILDLGLPLAFEFLDGENFQRMEDLPSYVWLGARDVGSQCQRKIASGISAPVGFKNHNVAGVKIALDAMSVAVVSNVFVASDDNGRASRFVTDGNPLCHLIHRGTDTKTNYDLISIADSVCNLWNRNLIPRIIVDASHGNSQKDHRNQTKVISYIVDQVASGNPDIAGFMYESYLRNRNQSIPKDLSKLKPGVSVTDECDGWERTERVLREAHTRLSQR